MYQSRHADAISEADKLAQAARNDGDRRFALFIKSVVYADQGKTSQAIGEVEKEYALDSKIGDPVQMAAAANAIGIILLADGKPAQAQKRFQQALDLQVNSSLSPEAKEDAKLAHHYDLGRVALAKGDLASAKTHADEYLKGAESKQNSTRVQQAHELAGSIALKEKNFDQAKAELAKADQQNPQVLYLLALADGGTEGHGVKAAGTPLPDLTYAVIRGQARKAAGGT